MLYSPFIVIAYKSVTSKLLIIYPFVLPQQQESHGWNDEAIDIKIEYTLIPLSFHAKSLMCQIAASKEENLSD